MEGLLDNFGGAKELDGGCEGAVAARHAYNLANLIVIFSNGLLDLLKHLLPLRFLDHVVKTQVTLDRLLALFKPNLFQVTRWEVCQESLGEAVATSWVSKTEHLVLLEWQGLNRRAFIK